MKILESCGCLKLVTPFFGVSGWKNSLWRLCMCFCPKNFHDDSWSIGSNFKHLCKFSSSWIRYIKNRKPKIAINYTYMNKKFSRALYWLLTVKFDGKRSLNIILTRKKCFQTVSRNFNFQLKNQIQVLQISQNRDWGQDLLLRSPSWLAIAHRTVLEMLYYAGITDRINPIFQNEW